MVLFVAVVVQFFEEGGIGAVFYVVLRAISLCTGTCGVIVSICCASLFLCYADSVIVGVFWKLGAVSFSRVRAVLVCWARSDNLVLF
jgi:hypothetical protein